jgi:hypothetical protein
VQRAMASAMPTSCPPSASSFASASTMAVSFRGRRHFRRPDEFGCSPRGPGRSRRDLRLRPSARRCRREARCRF